jgi:uncharacterized protein (TIGR03437 family)
MGDISVQSSLVNDGNGLYGLAGANSSSNPVVAGIVALMMEMKPSLTALQIRDILRQTARADSFTGPVPNPRWGYGKIDALAALNAVNSLSVPSLMITSVTTAGGFPDIAQNDWIEIKGSNLAPASTGPNGMTWSNAPEFASGQMPTQLNNVSVKVNGKPAFVYFISPGQINVLTPLENAVGLVQIVVTNGSESSAPFRANLHSAAPSFLRFGAGGYVASTHADGTLLGPASMSVPGYPFTPAQPGETISLYAVGFGLPVTTLVNGSSSQSGALPSLPEIQVGGDAATVQFAGVVGPGLYQFNVVVPATAGVVNGDNAIVATYGGSSTPVGSLIAVQR